MEQDYIGTGEDVATDSMSVECEEGESGGGEVTPRKRPRVGGAGDMSGLRRRILEHKLQRMRSMKERYVELGAELYFLQNGGNMMDYSVWRKRPPTPQLLAFLQARALEPCEDSEDLARTLGAAAVSPAPPGAEVKIPGMGATPVAVSTTLPAAVAQLGVRGWLADRPAGGRHGMVFAPIGRPLPMTAPKFPGGTPLIVDNGVPVKGSPLCRDLGSFHQPGATTQEQIVEKAKQEAYVVQRVLELQREGLWAERRLPRVMEPPRVKAHWDYLLEEMVWLAADFAQERKWKKAAAKKCARMVQKHFQDKAAAAQRARKEQELQIRRIAAFAAKEIRTFWSNVEKLVEFKRASRTEQRRKQQLERQLSFIVDQTERYSKQLAAGLTCASVTPPPTTPDDEEWRRCGGSEDDEETIAAAERGVRGEETRAEVEALRRESRLDLDQVMRELPPGYLDAASPPASPVISRAASPASSADYSGQSDSADDEDTIREQERAEDPLDATRELHQLKHESQMSIEELMKRYGGAAPSPPVTPAPLSDNETTDTDTEDNNTESEAETAALVESVGPSAPEGAGGEGEETRVQRAAALAAELQPTGYTLSETAVGTPVPRLLRHSLREYQHVGLHWLATMRSRRLNGILADEMGLGKTIQTIALLAHEALERGEWGPHLVVVPTSVMLNWEMEFKKWCPSFKILVYYGSIKERKVKRVGWTRPNAFHVCITSYKLVIQDHQSFRRKRWKYLILDEAQNIKNFKSQRWQLLLNFQTEQRLLLTGTPLQNNLMELWSLMHFLMPDVFASHTEFKEWFSPVAGMIDGTAHYNQHIVHRLHKVLRPFLLRRLKSEVEKQMPKKYEHVLMCRLSKRQRFLYDDFMSRAKTRESLSSGNLLSVMNILMQLRKVCNHPNLFESRPIVSPLQLERLQVSVPALLLLETVCGAPHPELATQEAQGAGAFCSHRARHLAPPRRLVEELACGESPPAPPAGAVRIHLRLLPPPPRLLSPPPTNHLLRRINNHLPPPSLPTTAPLASTTSATSTSSTPNADFAQGDACRRLRARRRDNLARLALVNESRCWRMPLLGADLRAAVHVVPPHIHAHCPPTVRSRLSHMHHIIDRFMVYVAGAVCASAQLAVGRGACAARSETERAAHVLEEALRPACRLLHPVTSRLAVAFPHPRLIQYDCGKLQRLDSLLRGLKIGGHRVLVFTQMTRMLDILEAFLNYHGHTYLRLDGSTRVDHRQRLVERFNNDVRVFAFILSTRSGGVGLNLTGADTVVFYDSDWNPTMDAQAQDRCHRIGQTRDVHIYRLVCERTVEENILRKATQKRQLGHLAIESGHFTTRALREGIQELLQSEGSESTLAAGTAVEEKPGELERALAACEDEADATAARTARAEQAAELAEFDENIPLEEEPRRAAAATTTTQIQQLEQQLSGVELYAMRVVEQSEEWCEAERTAAEDLERQLREWESARRAVAGSPPPPPPPETDSDDDLPLTLTREDATNQVWISDNTMEHMPMWCPPTPPQEESDVYVDVTLGGLYEPCAAGEARLPSVHLHRSPRLSRSPRPARRLPQHTTASTAHAIHAPRSLFERQTQLPRQRPRPRPLVTHESERLPEWTAAEEAALSLAVRTQGLPADITATPAALLPNWDFAADLVAEAARAYRSPRQCRDHYELVNPPRDDPLLSAERRKKKNGRGACRTPPPQHKEESGPPRLTLARFDAMRLALDHKTSAPKCRYDDPTAQNPKHAAVLAEYGVEYEAPPSPMEVATRRAERAKEKMKSGGTSTGATRAAAASTVAPAPASAPVPAPMPQPATPAVTQTQRIVVAAHQVPTVVTKGVGGGVVTPAQLQIFRQQQLARQQLKILQQQPHHLQQVQGGASGSSGVSSATRTAVSMSGTTQLRQLQLQQHIQMAQRKAAGSAVAAAGAASRGARVVQRPSAVPHHQVVVAHIAPPPPDPAQPPSSQ